MEAYAIETVLGLGLIGFLFLVGVVSHLRRRLSRRPLPSALKKVGAGGAEPEAKAEIPPPQELATADAAASQLETPTGPSATPGGDETTATLSWLDRIRQGLGKTRGQLTDNLLQLFVGDKKIDSELLEEVETLLLTADVGIEATSEIIQNLTGKLQRNQLNDGAELKAALRADLESLLAPYAVPLQVGGAKPFVILVVGVNGVGKTTTIGKLAKMLQLEGKRVMLAAGDTFRAAAVEQLQIWGERNNVPVIAQHTGADSASVIFDAVAAAQARDYDVVIADTAGRLQNKENLMAELEKVVRVMGKHDPQAPHEVLLILDAGTGQNALSQAQLFRQVVGVTGVAVTKLDGTAKGGIVFAIAKQHQLPLRYIGVGESIDDLRPFTASEFVEALLDA